MSDEDQFKKEFRERFSKYDDSKFVDLDNSFINAKYNPVCEKLYKDVLEWNEEWSGKEYRLSFKSELAGFLHPTTNCMVFFRKNDPAYKQPN